MSDLDREMEEVLEGSAPNEPAKRGTKGDKMQKGENIGDASGNEAPAITQPTKPEEGSQPKPVSKGKDNSIPSKVKGDQKMGKLQNETEYDQELEDVQEIPKLKSDILAGLVDHMKGLKKEDLEKLYGSYILEQDDEKEEEEDDDENPFPPKKKKGKNGDDEEEDQEASESITQRIESMDLSDDVAALIEGDDLSEEFKSKAAAIFEAAVKSKVRSELENMQSENDSIMGDLAESTMTDVVEKVDDYLNYVVEQWMTDNELAIERGLKGEIAEDFISGLKNLFEDHYIDVPDEKYDILESNLTKIEELEDKLNQQIEENIQLKKQKGELVKESMIADIADGMTDTETEKFVDLVADVEFSDEESYTEKLQTIKESYFGTGVSETSSDETLLTEEGNGVEEMQPVSNSMSTYMKAISKGHKRAQTDNN
jgi:hypothetical protein